MDVGHMGDATAVLLATIGLFVLLMAAVSRGAHPGRTIIVIVGIFAFTFSYVPACQPPTIQDGASHATETVDH